MAEKVYRVSTVFYGLRYCMGRVFLVFGYGTLARTASNDKKLSSLGNHPTTFTVPCSNLGRIHDKMKIGTRIVSKGVGKDHRGKNIDE